MNDTSSWGVPLVIIAAAIVTLLTVLLSIYWAPTQPAAQSYAPVETLAAFEELRRPWQDEPLEVKPIRVIPITGPARVSPSSGQVVPPQSLQDGVPDKTPFSPRAAAVPSSTVGRAQNVCERNHMHKETRGRGWRCVH
jgi:hypothetical protein